MSNGGEKVGMMFGTLAVIVGIALIPFGLVFGLLRIVIDIALIPVRLVVMALFWLLTGKSLPQSSRRQDGDDEEIAVADSVLADPKS